MGGRSPRAGLMGGAEPGGAETDRPLRLTRSFPHQVGRSGRLPARRWPTLDWRRGVPGRARRPGQGCTVVLSGGPRTPETLELWLAPGGSPHQKGNWNGQAAGICTCVRGPRVAARARSRMFFWVELEVPNALGAHTWLCASRGTQQTPRQRQIETHTHWLVRAIRVAKAHACSCRRARARAAPGKSVMNIYWAVEEEMTGAGAGGGGVWRHGGVLGPRGGDTAVVFRYRCARGAGFTGVALLLSLARLLEGVDHRPFVGIRGPRTSQGPSLSVPPAPAWPSSAQS